jgi:hypothetical protein
MPIYHYTKDATLSRKIEDYLDSGKVGSTSNVFTSPTAGDAFGRLRVSDAFTLFDSQHRYVENTGWSNALTGTGTTEYKINESAVELKAPAGTGTVKRQSRLVFPYQPGKSLLILNSFAFSTPVITGATTVTQRIGYFGESNGIFLEQTNGASTGDRTGGGLRIVLRSKASGVVTETTIEQANWNSDKFDGNGYSETTIDTSKGNIFWMDVEWLGVGDVRCGFIVNGKMMVAHTFKNTNANSTVYMTTATLPLRLELLNTGTTSPYIKHICNTVISEGGFQPRSTTHNQASNPDLTLNNFKTTGTDSTQWFNCVSIRLATTTPDAIIIPAEVEVLGTANAVYAWKLVKNATFATAPTWNTHSTCLTTEYTISNSVMTEGSIIKIGYFTSQSGAANSTLIGDINMQIGRTITNVSDTYTLAINSQANNGKFTGNIAWYQII